MDAGACRLRVGVFGVGSLGQWHARIYSEMPHTELCGVYDTNPDQARSIAERYHTRAFTSAQALAEEIEAASVVVPTHGHAEVALPLIRRGVHCLIEKPLAAALPDAETLVVESERAGIVLQVGHVERFNPVVGYLEKHVKRPRFIETVRQAPYPPSRPGLHPRGTEVGVVLDLMIHDLEIVQHVVQSPVRDIHAIGASVMSAGEDLANARLVFENGCVANLSASRMSRKARRKIRVFQDDSYASLDYQAQSGHWMRKAGGTVEAMDIVIEKDEPLLRELDHFSDCARHGRPPAVGGRQALEALRLAVSIQQCIQQGGS